MGIIHADSLPLLVTPERRLRGTRCQRLFAVIIRLREKLRKCMPGRGAFFRYQPVRGRVLFRFGFVFFAIPHATPLLLLFFIFFILSSSDLISCFVASVLS